MAFKPLHDRVLVRRVEGEEKTKGGLIIPDNAKEKPAEGEVIACGDGARKDNGELIAMAVKEGDRVLFGKWSGTEVTVNGEELLIMKESDSSASSPETLADLFHLNSDQGALTWLPRTSSSTPMPATACSRASTRSRTR